jgi:3-phosphoshikimate 1-carboxyvinyltransferase
MAQQTPPTECFIITSGQALSGTTTVTGDKSMSHRAVMLGAIADGTSHIRDWLPAGDTEASLRVMQALGAQVERHSPTEMTIHGGTLQPAAEPLDLVNAGTGIRLLAGIMVGQPFESVLDGSEQLRRRPMKRIIDPLAQMGANITGTDDRAPLHIKPANLRGIQYDMPVASGQVKSAVLLAGLFAEGETVVIQPGPARDHTERMLAAMGANITTEGNTVTLRPNGSLKTIDFTVPGDVSSAAFLIVAGLITPGSDITLTNINLNPTRTGLLDALQTMDADMTITETGTEAGDPVGTIHVKHCALKGTDVAGETVVRMIDEFPVFMVAALHAEGMTQAREAEELRVKETDRLAVMTAELMKMGAQINETTDGFTLQGPQTLMGAVVDGHDDHRIAMSLTVAGLVAAGQTTVLDARCAGDSFPGFAATLSRLGAAITVQALCES